MNILEAIGLRPEPMKQLLLGPLLDRNQDGSIRDDVAGMAGRFLNR